MRFEKRRKSFPETLIFIEVVLGLISASDLMVQMWSVVTLIQIGILALLTIEILYSLSNSKKVGLDEIVGITFVGYIILSVFWSKGLDLYDYAVNSLQIISAFVLYIACKRYGNIDFDKKIMKIFRIMLWLDLGLVAYQVLRLNINSDFSNGIFGSTHYYNGAQGLFCLVCCFYSLYLYFLKENTRNIFMTDILASCLICALSEIKTFFFLIIIILALYIILEHKIEKNILKKIAMIAGIIVAIMVAFNILSTLYGQNTVVFSNKSSMLQYLGYSNSGYSSGSRFGDIETFFEDNIDVIIIGVGFPQGVKSSVYGMASLLHSVGLLGCAILVLFFVVNAFMARRKGREFFYFSIAYSFLCLMAEVVWAGIFGSIVSYFSIIALAMITRKSR